MPYFECSSTGAAEKRFHPGPGLMQWVEIPDDEVANRSGVYWSQLTIGNLEKAEPA